MKRLLFVLLLTAVSARAEIYTWKDAKGTAHYTNSTVEIPARYKAKAKVLNLGLEQKDGQTAQTGQAAGQPAPAAAPAAPTPAAPSNAQVQAAPPTPAPAIAPDRVNHDRRYGVRRPARVLQQE